MRDFRGNGGTAAARHLEGRNVWRSVFSFASLISFISLSCLLPLSGCSRTVSAQPGVVNFVIETSPTNLDPRIGTDAVSERMDGLIFSSLVELDVNRTGC